MSRNLIAASRGERDLVDAIAGYESRMVDHGFAAVRDSLKGASQFVSGRPTCDEVHAAHGERHALAQTPHDL